MVGYYAHRDARLPRTAPDKLPTLIWEEPPPGKKGDGPRWLPIIEKLIATPNRWARVNDGHRAALAKREIWNTITEAGYDRADFQFRKTSGTSPNTRGRREYLFVMYEPGVFHWPGES